MADQLYRDRCDQSYLNLCGKGCGWLEKEKNNLQKFFSHVEGERIGANIGEMIETDTYAASLEIVALSAILLRTIHIHAYDYYN